ncbi:D-beta-hydroxybutyrate dehydrogenase, mitochondrial [Mizuhopecten yessoensis]|uniref:D-beta-hydroxybutyrate dehydrogenase, mitochondrial n=1 Tax=Mizuhopecten yessoensis TaxID=6573 RepID=A0A210QXF2_MIZYE|nr:D-beta-hydroxybutyrate dehydrogenase, mitochondrial [Mizuhopecten yessoensis]
MLFNSPSVTADAIPGGLHVMSPTLPTNGECRTDVSFTPSGQGDRHICLTAALPSATGEKRCYNLHVPVGSPAATPCESQNCQHGGLCTGDPSGSTATCSCAAGYSGTDCSTVGAHNVGDTAGNSIQPSAGSPPVVTDTVVPDTISCVVNTVCHVPLLVTGDPNNPPTLTPVWNDPGTQIGKVSVPQPPHQLPGSPPGTYKGDVTVTSTTVGSHTSCVQTAAVTGNTAQTVCFNVNVIGSLPPGSTATSSGQQIVEPTLPDGSVVKCSKGKSCHILIHTAPKGSQCDPRVAEKRKISGGINVFAPVKDTDGTCVTDIRLPSDTVGNQHICFQVAPNTIGGNTESRCYDLHIGQDPCITLPCPTTGTCIPGSGFPKCQCKPGYIGLTCNTHDLCASKTCNNGGVCIIRDSSAFCLCPPGKQGSDCAVDASTPIPGSPSGTNTDPRFVDTVLPKRISCTVGEECKIQVPVAGSSVTSSNVQFGHLDNGVTPGSATVDPSVVSTDQHLATFPFTPTSAGDKRVCLQTKETLQNVDEMCFIVDAKSPPAGITTHPDITKPQFSSPSLPDNSVVECKAGATCHIHLSTNPGGSGNNCPDIVQTVNGQMHNVHVFKTTQAVSVTNPVCQSTVTLAPTNSQIGDQHICLKPTTSSKQGKSKCFTIKVTDPNNGASTGGPCQSTHCHNGGTCEIDFTRSTPTAKCVCTAGFQGPTCDAGIACGSTNCQNGGVCVVQNSQPVCVCPPGKIGTLCANDGSTPIAGSPSVPSGVPIFVDTALLKSITCVINQPCAIPLPVTGSAITPSDLQFGQVDTGISTGPISVGQTLGNQNMASFVVTPTMSGKKHVCMQTKTTTSNVDEVCVEVNAVSPPSLGSLPPGPSSSKPQFTSPSIPDNSIVECKAGSTCYIHLKTTPGTTVNTCPDVIQTNGVNRMQNLVVIPSSSGGSSSSTCSSTVAIKPTNSQHGNHHVCLSPTQLSGTGMKKCISVHVTDSTDSTTGGPCQAFHCQNSGHCVAVMTSSPPQAHCNCTGTFTGPTCVVSTNPVLAGPCNSKHCLGGGVCIVKNGLAACLCPSGKMGDLCEHDGSTTIHGSPTVSPTDPVFVDTALPKTLKCFVGKQCTIALPVSGTGVTTSDTTFGLVDPGITQGQVTVHPLSGSSSLLHIPVTPTQAGNKHVCIQTKTATSNIDEVCFNVNALQPPAGTMPAPPDINKPQFTSPTLPDSSVVECEVHSPCHIHLATTPGTSDNSCPGVEQTGLTQMKNLAAFYQNSTTSSSITCNTDVTISPTNSETGDNHVCLTPTKASGEQGKPRCITVHVVVPHSASAGGPCQNLHCQNNGKCIATSTVMPSSALCTCAAGFNGPTCGTSLTAVDPCTLSPLVCQNGGVCKNKNGKAFCLCPPGWTGRNCQTDSSPPVNGVSGLRPDPAFIDTAIPTKVECPVGQACTIPLLLKGSGVTSSDLKFGHVDSGITPGTVSVDPTSGTENLVQVHVAPTTVGEKRVCVQTKRPNSITKGSEACFIIKATQNSGGVGPVPPPDHSKPQFTPSTLPDHSIIQCQAGSTCHIYIGTHPSGTDHTCPSVVQSGVTHMQNTHSFPLTTSPSPGNICHSVMSFAPAAGPEENRVVCFTPTQANGLHGQEKCLNIVVKPENCGAPITDMNTAREATKMGRTTCKCTLTSGKEVVVINKRPKATTIQLLKAAGIGAGSVSGAIAIATIIYMIVGKIKDASLSKPGLGGNKTHSDKTIPQASRSRPLPRQRR